MKNECSLSRRQFLSRTATLASAAALGDLGSAPMFAAGLSSQPIVVFSKVYREAKLSLEDSVDLTAEVGLDGLDCPVRPNEQVLPERVKDDLPRYVELLRKRNLQMPLLTTAIFSPQSPYTNDILSTAKRLGIRYYRVGFLKPEKGVTMEQTIVKTRAQFKELAAMNKDLGLCALAQNHSPGRPSGYLGGDLNDMFELVKDFDPAQLGIAFDLGHAILVHGDEWSLHFEKLKPYIWIAYIKDAKRGKGFVRFGEGEFSQTDYFKRLKAMGYSAPFSLHIEYPWVKPGEEKTRAALAPALKDSLRVLKGWLATA